MKVKKYFQKVLSMAKSIKSNRREVVCQFEKENIRKMKIFFFWWRINTEKEKKEIFGEENIF